MTPSKSKYDTLADNLKRMLRIAMESWKKAGQKGSFVTIHTPGLVSIDPLLGGFVTTLEEAVELSGCGEVVFLPRVGQFGVPHERRKGEYIALQADAFVAGLTHEARDKDEAYGLIEPYYRAILNLT